MNSNITTQQLGEISLIMGDAVHFTQLRFLLEGLQEDENKQKILDIVEKFYILCKYAEKL